MKIPKRTRLPKPPRLPVLACLPVLRWLSAVRWSPAARWSRTLPQLLALPRLRTGRRMLVAPKLPTRWWLAALPCLLAACTQPSAPPEPEDAPARQPNFLLIVADDLGYTDIGAYGGEIRTPVLDDLASRSVMFTNFHVLPMCAPTRAMLLAGTEHHVAGLGTMFGPNFLPALEGHTGYETYLHERVASLPERLAEVGYRSYMAGKWHLGPDPGQWPVDRGFDRSFVLLPGSGSHMVIPERQYVENGEWVEPTEEGFYSTRAYTDKLIGYIDEFQGDGQPFFVYAAYTSPHWPLQVPPEFIDRYAGDYDEGYDALRVARMARAEALGVIPETDPDYFEPLGPAWEELNSETQAHYARRMELYAAMVENLDHHVGRLIDHLENIGELDNTVILFMSDNGAATEQMEYNPGFSARIERENSDNSLENLGAADSYISYGANWAQAATAPFNRFKGFITEGGTLVPAFVLHGDSTNPTGLDGQYLSAIDIAPTLLELAGATIDSTSVQGREVAAITGRSFARVLGADAAPVYPEDHIFALEMHGSRAVRQGRYKLVWEQPAVNTWWPFAIPESWYRWQLYDLQTDPGERYDIGAEHPELMRQLIDAWEDYADTYGVVREVRIHQFERWQVIHENYPNR